MCVPLVYCYEIAVINYEFPKQQVFLSPSIGILTEFFFVVFEWNFNYSVFPAEANIEIVESMNPQERGLLPA